jgi:hypothetical protein
VKFPRTRISSYGYRTGGDLSVEEIAADLIGQVASTEVGIAVSSCVRLIQELTD